MVKTTKVKIFIVWVCPDLKHAAQGKWLMHSVHGTRSEANAAHTGINYAEKITQKTIKATL